MARGMAALVAHGSLSLSKKERQKRGWRLWALSLLKTKTGRLDFETCQEMETTSSAWHGMVFGQEAWHFLRRLRAAWQHGRHARIGARVFMHAYLAFPSIPLGLFQKIPKIPGFQDWQEYERLRQAGRRRALSSATQHSPSLCLCMSPQSQGRHLGGSSACHPSSALPTLLEHETVTVW